MRQLLHLLGNLFLNYPDKKFEIRLEQAMKIPYFITMSSTGILSQLIVHGHWTDTKLDNATLTGHTDLFEMPSNTFSIQLVPKELTFTCKVTFAAVSKMLMKQWGLKELPPFLRLNEVCA